MIQAVRGTKDLLPGEIEQWQAIEKVFREASARYGYRELRSPIFEKTEVFSRSIGENTDIVNKEMYTFTDRGGDSLTLRPEMTAALVRSVIQNKIIQQTPLSRLWYFGSFFRYERPQKGRLRQFHQYGAECLGSNNPESDAEVILLANNLIKSAGIDNFRLFLNTLGSDESRAAYRNELIAYLNSKKESLSHDSVVRLEHNPLRVLDSKAPEDKDAVENAPVILDFLDEESSVHFETVKSLLDKAGIEYIIQPRLVRGLDYYNHTVFEFQHEALGAQDSFGGGGRYNKLFEELGGKPTPAIGFALGVERMLLILENTDKMQGEEYRPDFFTVLADNDFYAFAQGVGEKLRQRGYKVVTDLMRRSMKAQFKEANKQNARYTLIIGEDEVDRNVVQVKNMELGEQKEYPIADLDNAEF